MRTAGDPDTVADTLACYRLVAAWLLRIACRGGPPQLPLSEPAPLEFATLPVRNFSYLYDHFFFVCTIVLPS